MARASRRLLLPAWQLFGIPIHVDRSWLFFAAFVTWTLATGYFPEEFRALPTALYWLMGFLAALLLFACVLLHEMGHSLTARAFGIPVVSVTLFIFGGIAQIAGEARRPSVELRIALAGPLVSLAIALGCVLLTHVMPLTTQAHVVGFALLRYLALVNTALIVFNLLPGFPLDGGRVLRAVLWGLTRDEARATRIASLLGLALGVGLMLLGAWWTIKGEWLGGLWYVFLGLFLREAAQNSYRRAA